MKKIIYIFIILLVFAAPLHSQDKKDPQLTAVFDPGKYYTKFYTTVIHAMLDRGMQDEKNFGEKERAELVALIYREMPTEEFSKKFKDQYYKFLESVKASGHYKGKEEERAIGATDSVAMPIAMMICSGCIDIYLRKTLHPDFTKPFFDHAENWDEQTIIAWISDKVDGPELDSINFGNFELKSNDTVFHFISPPVTWNIMTGREGYAVIRENKLVYHIITTMN